MTLKNERELLGGHSIGRTHLLMAVAFFYTIYVQQHFFEVAEQLLRHCLLSEWYNVISFYWNTVSKSIHYSIKMYYSWAKLDDRMISKLNKTVSQLKYTITC